MADPWADLNIPDSWTATAMLRNMVSDHIGPDKSFDGPLDDITRNRMIGLALMGHVELADKTARLIEQFSTLLGEIHEIAERHNALREAIVKLAAHVDFRGD